MICDEELCHQVQEGNEAAMEALVHRFHRPVFGYLFRHLENRSAAEDLTQETFARLLVRVHQYRFPQPFKPWLFTIAQNLYRDHCKAQANRSTVPVAEPISPAVPEPYDLSLRIAERIEVITAIRSLEAPQREVLLLRYYHDLKVDEIADVVGVPSGTIKSRLFGAMGKLRDLLGAEEGGHGREASGKGSRQ